VATDRTALLSLLILALIPALAFQGSRGLFETSEGRYAEIAREMTESGNYLEPTLDHEPHWAKPPLTYWAIAAGTRMFGKNEWGARFYNVVAFVVTVLAVAACGRELWDRETGLVAGLVYLSAFAPAIGTFSVTTDTLLSMWETLAVLCYVKAYRRGRNSGARGWTRTMWLAFGLAFLTKGPPALLPLVALIIFHVHARRPFALADVAGIAVFVVTSLWWYLAVAFRHHGLTGYFLAKEVVARMFSSDFGRNTRWYGAVVIYLPFLLVGPGLWLYDAIRLAKRSEVFKPAGLKRIFESRGEPSVFTFIWFTIPLIIFFLSRSRLQLYILPLFVPLALATARTIILSYGTASGVRRSVGVAVVSIVLIVAGKAAYSRIPSHADMGRLYRTARSAAGGDSRFALYREKGLYGLEFYADGKIQRVSESPDENWADVDLSSFVEELLSDSQGGARVVIASDAHAGRVRDALSGAGLPYEETRDAGWRIFVVNRVDSGKDGRYDEEKPIL
jgi:4-amino-4-deoxy-L-arabinose transferase